MSSQIPLMSVLEEDSSTATVSRVLNVKSTQVVLTIVLEKVLLILEL